LSGLYQKVPSFPKKRYIGSSTSPKFIEKRCAKLSDYLNNLTTLPGVMENQAMQIFCATTLSGKGEDEKAMLKLANKTHIEVAEPESAKRLRAFKMLMSPEVVKTDTPEGYGLSRLRGQTGGNNDERSASLLGRPGEFTLGMDGMSANMDSLAPEAEGPPPALPPSSRSYTFDQGPPPPLPTSERSYSIDQGTPPPLPTSERSYSIDQGTPPPLPPEATTSTAQYVGTTMQALFSFQGCGDTELSFEKGDMIRISETDNSEWWYGTVGQKSGFFPCTYVISSASGN